MNPLSLPSWNDGPIRQALLDFVSRVTQEGGADYVPPSERVAVFDNDGTLWCEQPMQSQFFFAIARLRALAEKDPSLEDREPYKTFLAHDHEAIINLGKEGVFEVAFLTHAGGTQEEFHQEARAWMATATHPVLGRLLTQCVYQPQVELLDYLAANGFKNFIVSGGGIDLMRAFAEEAYGIPPERVIGSSTRLRYETRDGRGELVKTPALGTFSDREVKPENIGLHIGRRPILAFGNSDGDLAMMRYVKSGPGARLALLLHHDDAEREFAYDRAFRFSPLIEAFDRAVEFGFEVVSMKRDWKTVFVG